MLKFGSVSERNKQKIFRGCKQEMSFSGPVGITIELVAGRHLSDTRSAPSVKGSNVNRHIWKPVV